MTQGYLEYTGTTLEQVASVCVALQGKAGKAQVEGARFLVENCGGGAFMDVHFTILGNDIPGRS